MTICSHCHTEYLFDECECNESSIAKLEAENTRLTNLYDNLLVSNVLAVAENARLRKPLTDSRNAIASLDRDALGIGGDGMTHWSIRDELLANIDKALEE